jgi:hypothetical protein
VGFALLTKKFPDFNEHKKGSADHATAPQSFPAANNWLLKKRLSQVMVAAAQLSRFPQLPIHTK